MSKTVLFSLKNHPALNLLYRPLSYWRMSPISKGIKEARAPTRIFLGLLGPSESPWHLNLQ